jgi:hypothetical protein
MRRLATASLLVLVTACSPGSGIFQLTPQTSPDGNLVLSLYLDGSIVKGRIRRASDEVEVGRIDTRASDVMKWAIGWYDSQTIVLDSSDIGIYAWRRDGEEWRAIDVDRPMCERAQELFRTKYGDGSGESDCAM